MELATITGTRVNLPGEGLSWVNFWSISCPPCLKEMPYLEKLHQEYKGKMQIVAVSVPYDPPNVIKDYQTRESLTLPMAMDLDGRVLSEFTKKLVVPSHYLVDAKGNILLTHLGEIDEATIRATLEKYL
ncbi:MAG: TlpA disulfide reductase family protein [Thiolinea sp.]